MTEAQKQLIERAGWACVHNSERAAYFKRIGWLSAAAEYRERAVLSSRLAFDLARGPQS